MNPRFNAIIVLLGEYFKETIIAKMNKEAMIVELILFALKITKIMPQNAPPT